MRRLLTAAAATLVAAGVLVGVSASDPPAAGAATGGYVATDDATVRSDNPDTRIWGLEYLRTEAATPVRMAYLKFDVDAVPDGEIVQSATLTVHGLSTAPATLTANTTGTDWTEGTLTYNNRPPVGAALDSTPYGAAVDLDVTAAVTGNGQVAFAVTTDAADFRDIASRENTTASLRPILTVVSAAPPPGPEGQGDDIALGHYRNRPGEGGSWRDKVNRNEAQFGPFEGHLRDYMGAGSSGQLSTLHQQAIADGRGVFINWKPQSTTWAQVASGGRDTVIRAAATQWHNVCPDAAPGTPVLLIRCWVTIGHEPDNDIGGAGSGMTSADFVGMFRRTSAIFHELAPEVPVIWTVMGFAGNRDLYPGLWPGAEYVDLIGHNPYIKCSGPPANLATFIIDSSLWLRSSLPGAADKPIVITEWGADLGGNLSPCGSGGSIGSAQHRADAIDGVTDRLPEVKAVGVVELDLFDSRSDAISCGDMSCVDAQAYARLKAATEIPPAVTAERRCA